MGTSRFPRPRRSPPPPSFAKFLRLRPVPDFSFSFAALLRPLPLFRDGTGEIKRILLVRSPGFGLPCFLPSEPELRNVRRPKRLCGSGINSRSGTRKFAVFRAFVFPSERRSLPLVPRDYAVQTLCLVFSSRFDERLSVFLAPSVESTLRKLVVSRFAIAKFNLIKF